MHAKASPGSSAGQGHDYRATEHYIAGNKHEWKCVQIIGD